CHPSCFLLTLSSPFLLQSPCPYFLLSIVTLSPATHALSLHDALPIFVNGPGYGELIFTGLARVGTPDAVNLVLAGTLGVMILARSEEHTSELQSRFDLVCRLLLEEKKHA